jgi:hypothetical protein
MGIEKPRVSGLLDGRAPFSVSQLCCPLCWCHCRTTGDKMAVGNITFSSSEPGDFGLQWREMSNGAGLGQLTQQGTQEQPAT